jgi:hypothetical protein
MNPGSDWPITKLPSTTCPEVLPPHIVERLHCSGQMNLVKYPPPTPPPTVDSLMLAYFLMFARTPRKAEPDVDGSYSLGEIGSDVEKNWSRLTPYSPSQRQQK